MVLQEPAFVNRLPGQLLDLYEQELEFEDVYLAGGLGNWLLKGKAAWFDGLEYGNLPGRNLSRLDIMGGIEYMGFSETVLSLEIVNRHLVDFDEQLTFVPDVAWEDSIQTVLKLVRDFANDTFQLKILLSIFGGHGEDGMFKRFQLDYDFTDAVILNGGIIFCQSGDQSPFRKIEGHLAKLLFCPISVSQRKIKCSHMPNMLRFYFPLFLELEKTSNFSRCPEENDRAFFEISYDFLLLRIISKPGILTCH